jgi:hypothetical protein
MDDKALTVMGDSGKVIARVQQYDPDLAKRAVGIWSSRPQDNPISPQRALAAALYEQQTGQVCGRDFYVDENMGIVPGYRGINREAADAGAGSHIEQYRPFTAQENEEHEIQVGDTARACELTQVAVARQCREAGIKYQPVIGYGIVRAKEKINQYQKPIQLKGGYTWVRKATNRCFKDALRHAGLAATAEEVIEDAETNGVDVDVPESAHLSVEQAERAVEAERAMQEWRQMHEQERQRIRAEMHPPEDFKGFGDEPDTSSLRQEEAVEGEVVEHQSESLPGNNGQDADAEFAALPSASKQAKQQRTQEHWIDIPDVRKRFWAWCTAHDLTETEVHEVLNVYHVNEYPGTMGDAKTALTIYYNQRTDEGVKLEAA